MHDLLVYGICHCVKNHNPNPMQLHRHHILPQEWGGRTTKENTIDICPNTHYNVHNILDEAERLGHMPDWTFLKHYSKFTRSLAAEGWRRHLTLSA